MVVKINSIKLIYFSPTQTTRKILESVARGIPIDSVESLDLTPPEAETGSFADLGDELVIVGAPVYGGRIPVEAARRLRRLRGRGTPAVVIVVYGNREYEDALLELRDLVQEIGFRPVAGGAFIGEHSFDTETTPIANGRPDVQDLEKAVEAGTAIWQKLMGLETLDEVLELRVPGNYPYKELGQRRQLAPVTREDLCVRCEECAAACPTAAITIGEAVTTDKRACIWCCACVKVCPTGARVMDDPHIERLADWLTTNYSARKEPEFYV